MPTKAVTEPCQERRGLDFATAVFVSASPRHQQEVFDRAMAVLERSHPSLRWKEAGRSSHFERVFSHDIGARLELTELESGSGRNPGLTALSLPGAFFYTGSSDTVMTALWDITNADGFKWFTRLDFQNTELRPEWDMERVYQGVVAGELWVKGYGSRREAGDVLADGSCPGGRTVYWGSQRSERQARSYDKAKESGWDTAAIRDEVQFRGKWAQSFGRELAAELRANLTTVQMEQAVSRLAVSALNQHLQYWELHGTDPTTDKNWQRKAKPADWYAARIGKHCEPLRKDTAEPLDLLSSVRHGIRTYGRLFALWAGQEVTSGRLTAEQAARRLGGAFVARLKPEDLDWLLGDLDTADKADLLAEFRQLLNEVARQQEMDPDGL